MQFTWRMYVYFPLARGGLSASIRFFYLRDPWTSEPINLQDIIPTAASLQKWTAGYTAARICAPQLGGRSSRLVPPALSAGPSSNSSVQPSVKNSCPIQLFVRGFPFTAVLWMNRLPYLGSKFVMRIVAVFLVSLLSTLTSWKKGGVIR